MFLKILGHDFEYECGSVAIKTVEGKDGTYTIASIECSELINHLIELDKLREDSKKELAANVLLPPAPKKIEYEPTNLMGDHTIKDYLEAGWDHAAMLSQGLIRTVEKVAYESNILPEKPNTKALANSDDAKGGVTVSKTTEIVMTAKANGATLESFEEAGWSRDQLIEHGYAKLETVDVPVAPPIELDEDIDMTVKPVVQEEEDITAYPKKIDGRWYDKAGTCFDAEIHGLSKGVPSVKVDGTFKKKRGVSDELYNSKIASQQKPPVDVPTNEELVEDSIAPDVIEGDNSGDYDSELKRIMAEFG